MLTLANCPYCQAEISVVDPEDLNLKISCPRCSKSLVVGSLKPQVQLSAATKTYLSLPVKPEGISAGNIAASYVIAVALPFIGFFVGIYLMAKKEHGHGVACIALSIASAVGWAVFLL